MNESRTSRRRPARQPVEKEHQRAPHPGEPLYDGRVPTVECLQKLILHVAENDQGSQAQACEKAGQAAAQGDATTLMVLVPQAGEDHRRQVPAQRTLPKAS